MRATKSAPRHLNEAMTRLTTRSSTIFIGIGEETRVYRSVDQVPPELQRKLRESTRSMNSATILIADKRGREELVRALQGRATDVRCRLAASLRTQTVAEQPAPAPRPGRFAAWRRWLELLLPMAVGASLWFFIDSHF
jgi:hypothetical protein